MRQRSDQPLRQRKARDRALILPLVGLLLLVPPIAAIFQIEARVGRVPFLLVYLFAVWAMLIAGAAGLAGRLRDIDAGAVADEDGPGES